MTEEKRNLCKTIAGYVGAHLPNSELAGQFQKAGHGLDEHALMVIDLALDYYETLNVRRRMFSDQ